MSAAGYCFLLTANEDIASVAQFQLPEKFNAGVVEGQGMRVLSTQEVSFERCQLRTSGNAANRVFLQQFPATSSWNLRAIERLPGNQSLVNILQPQCNLILDFQQLPTGTIWALFIKQTGQLLLEAIGANGLLRQTMLLDFGDVSIADAEDQMYRLYHDGSRVIVLTGRHVWRIDPIDIDVVDHAGVRTIRPILVVEFPQAPQSMIASPVNTTLRVAFSSTNGVQAVWPLNGNTCAFAQDLLSPLVISTGNGLFVAACASNSRIECYRLNAGQAEFVAELDFPTATGPDPMRNLFPSHAPNEFLVLHESGTLKRFQIPVR